MDSDLGLRKKYTFRSGNQKLILIKKPMESNRHVLMKAFLWALYLPAYPDLQVEVPIGDRYKPDLVQMGESGPCFWAEAGHVGNQKLRRLLKRFPQTHIALAVWGQSIRPMVARVRGHRRRMKRSAPIDVIGFSENAVSRFVKNNGSIHIAHDELDWQRLS
jgi:hypothetical protein